MTDKNERGTPRKRTTADNIPADTTLWELEENWRQTFDAIPDPISVHDTSFTILRVNRAFAELFHTTPDQLVGRKCYRLFHNTDSPIAGCPHGRTLETGGSMREELFEPSLNGFCVICP